ncbi:MAG: hypothetical protein LBU36_05515 [Clostridiales bacterium]|jgi:stage V sporulation protein D (sporulation-specific penicillin-binding protein)|nr:hypothetical protein [Clostridiales bacterium]
MERLSYDLNGISENGNGGRRAEREKRRREKSMRGKINFMRAVLALSIAGLLGRVGYIKAVLGEEYKLIVTENQAISYEQGVIKAARGEITDRAGQSIAVVDMRYNVILDVREMIKADEAAAEENAKNPNSDFIAPSRRSFAALSGIMGVPEEELEKYIRKGSDGKPLHDTHYFRIGVIDHDQYMKLKNNKDIIRTFWEEAPIRAYVDDRFAPQVVGFIRGDNKWGVEKNYNSYLEGSDGDVGGTINQNGEIVESRFNAVNGATVELTLDSRIQGFAQAACDKAIDEFEAENASVIVMDPQKGEILAMAQAPSFSLSDVTNINLMSGESLKKDWDNLTEAEQSERITRAWNNFNVFTPFEPGSIFKPVTVAAALEEGVITKSVPSTYYCGGYKLFDDANGKQTRINCHLRSGHGNIVLAETLAKSCNVAMMDIASLLERDSFYKYQRDFGFGEKTGIDLPAEASARKLIYPVEKLGPVELATSSFGQRFKATAIQSATAFAALINGGNLMRPYVVSRVTDPKGNVVKENAPKVIRKVISKSTSDYLRNAMELTVTEGTGKKARIEGYNIGGKTGTAEQSNANIAAEDKRWTFTYIAYLPVENPQIMTMVTIHNVPGSMESETTAAPMLKDMLIEIIKYKGIPPSDPTVNIAKYNLDANKRVVGSYEGGALKDAISDINRLGVKFEIVGAGGSKVERQMPPADSEVDDTSVVYLTVSKDADETLITVPDLSGLTVSQAAFFLENTGLMPFNRDVGPAADGGAEDDTPDRYMTETPETPAADGQSALPPEDVQEDPKVTSQMPAAGVFVAKGTQVSISSR